MQNLPLHVQAFMNNYNRAMITPEQIAAFQAQQQGINPYAIVANPYYQGIQFAPNNNNIMTPQLPQGVLPSDDQYRYINQQMQMLDDVDKSIQKKGVIPRNVDLRNINL